MAKKDPFRSNLRNARGLGAAGHGVEHWWLQRLTALALIPLGIWFVASLLEAVLFPTPEMVADWLASPITALLLALFIIAIFVHACLGLQVVVEDYVKCPFKKYGLLIGIKLLGFILGTACLLAILRLHLIDIGLAF